MIQSDALSRQPDYIPETDTDNEDRILLPENMFVNLMDLDLQDRIANTDKYDFDVKNTLELLLENGPNSLQQDLEDWRLEKHGDKNILFYKDKNYIPDCYEHFIFTFTYMLTTLNHATTAWFIHFISYIC